jgi:hypothetical protein
MTSLEAPGVGAVMMLCDHVAVADGKFYINGGAWTVAGPGPMPMAIALLLQVPWTMTNRPVRFRLSLHFEDGQPVETPGPAGQAPLEIGGEIEVGRPPGAREGVVFNAPIAINVGPVALVPGLRYYWQLAVDDRSEEGWHLAFEWRAQHQAADPAGSPLPRD